MIKWIIFRCPSTCVKTFRAPLSTLNPELTMFGTTMYNLTSQRLKTKSSKYFHFILMQLNTSGNKWYSFNLNYPGVVLKLFSSDFYAYLSGISLDQLLGDWGLNTLVSKNVPVRGADKPNTLALAFALSDVLLPVSKFSPVIGCNSGSSSTSWYISAGTLNHK